MKPPRSDRLLRWLSLTCLVGLLFLAVLILVGIASSLIATRFGAPLLLVFLIIGMLAGEDGPGGIVFFWARVAHYIVYIAAIPYLRTLTFAISWAATVAIFLQIVI